MKRRKNATPTNNMDITRFFTKSQSPSSTSLSTPNQFLDESSSTNMPQTSDSGVTVKSKVAKVTTQQVTDEQPNPEESANGLSRESRKEDTGNSSTANSVDSGSSKSISIAADVVDIGHFINGTMTKHEVSGVIKRMDDSTKYRLIKHHIETSTFIQTQQDDSNRSFQQSYFYEQKDKKGSGKEKSTAAPKKREWVRYSPLLNGAYCIDCVLFVDGNIRPQLEALVNTPLNRWSRAPTVLKNHSTKPYHIQSVSDSLNFVRSIEKPQTNIQNMLEKGRVENIKKNRELLSHLIKAVLFLGRQGLAFRGHDESQSSRNRGNFLELLHLISEYNDPLQNHLTQTGRTLYTSPTSQNELINIIAHDCIRSKIIERIKNAQFFSIICDEASSGTTEFMSLVLRFVCPDTKKIEEQFLTFQHVTKCTGRLLGERILKTIDDLGLDITRCRGQGYDGAAAMSSDACGVQATVKEVAPLAAYMHCASHCLNLVIVHSCRVLSVKNVIDKISSVCTFFNSPLRTGLLKELIKIELGVTKSAPLIKLCETRWSQRHVAYTHFLKSYKFIVQSLELISYGMHKDRINKDYHEWAHNTKIEAGGILTAITHSDFIAGFGILYTLLNPLEGITQKLQGRGLDVSQAHQMVAETKEYYRKLRSQEDDGSWFKLAEKLGGLAETALSLPRIAGRMTHRGNIPSVGVQEYYFRNDYLPFLDHILSQLDDKFTSLSTTAALLLTLPNLSATEEDLDKMAAYYEDDLPHPEMLQSEFRRLKLVKDTIGDTITEGLLKCPYALYPNIHTLLLLAGTLPVTPCECERSFSTLRRLNSYLRRTQTSQRLDSLALINIHCSDEVDVGQVIDSFSRLHSRKLELGTIVPFCNVND